MARFRRMRVFGGVQAAVAGVLQTIEQNISDVVDALTAEARPVWRSRSTDAVTVQVNPWELVRVTQDCRVLLPQPNLSNQGQELGIIVPAGVTATILAVVGNVNGASTYSASGVGVYRFTSSGQGWYLDA